MANFLNDYSQDVVTNSDYLHSLRLFTKQHYLPDGTINLVENYDPDKGGPVVYYYWSNHYLHSSYNNLVISGLCGIRPSDDDSLVINPLVDSTINYFCLSGLNYHGHKLTVVFDKEGTKYNAGRGLTIHVEGQKVSGTRLGNKYKVYIGSTRITPSSRPSPNYALNIDYKGFPQPSASVNSVPDSIFQAVDGRIWYFPEIRNRWSTLGSKSSTDRLAIDFGQAREISEVKMYLFADKITFGIPDEVNVEYKIGEQWLPVKIKRRPRKNLLLIPETVGFLKS